MIARSRAAFTSASIADSRPASIVFVDSAADDDEVVVVVDVVDVVDAAVTLLGGVSLNLAADV